MPDLEHTLQGHDLGFLRIVARAWGIDLNAPDAVTALPVIVKKIIEHSDFAEVIEALPQDARNVLQALVENDGRMPWAAFNRKYGDVRRMGSARRDRERPDIKPSNAVEVLWYRGLIGRAFLSQSPETEPQEYAYIPDDVLPLLPILHGDARLFFLIAPVFAFMLLDRRAAWWTYGVVVASVVVFGVVSFAGGYTLLMNNETHTPLIYTQDATLLGLFSWTMMASLMRYQYMLQGAFQREQQARIEQQNLERQVAERNQALQNTFQVSEKLAGLQDPDMLVVTVTEDIKRTFGYYHVHVYLLEEASQDLVLMGGSGEVGRALMDRRPRVPAGRGLVGRAAQSRQPALVPDTAGDPAWLPNPLLPETRSEMALPIIVGEQLLGVLDIQQNTVGGLGQQDVELMLWVAKQLGGALQNARQYVAAQRMAGREARAGQILRRLQSATTVDDLLQVTVRELGTVLTADRAQIALDLKRPGQ